MNGDAETQILDLGESIFVRQALEPFKGVEQNIKI